MTGSHEVRGSIPLSSTNQKRKGDCFVERPFSYWFHVALLQGVGQDVDGVRIDGRIMAGPGAGQVEDLDPVHFNP